MAHHHHPTPGDGSPWQTIREMREQMDRLLSSAIGRGGPAPGWEPAVDITEQADGLQLIAELPGMTKDDIDIELENNVLTIRGEKREEREEHKGERYLYERSFGTFSRSFTLPRTVDPERIQARFANGVLRVHMPKTERAKGKRITIEGGEG